jgi:hypothetical protein
MSCFHTKNFILSYTVRNRGFPITNYVTPEPEHSSPYPPEPSTGTYSNQPNPLHPHSISPRSILILSSHLRLGLPSSLLHLGFHIKTLYIFLSSPMRATCPSHFILLPHFPIKQVYVLSTFDLQNTVELFNKNYVNFNQHNKYTLQCGI